MGDSPFRAGGALTDDHASLYREREADRQLVAALRNMDYVLIIEPRQQGKTSLINYMMRNPALEGFEFAYVDLTTLDCSTDSSWYETIAPRILRQLRKVVPRQQWPETPRSSVEWRDFLWDIAAMTVDAEKRTVIALDEVGAIAFPGATAFFSVLRDVYNSRQAETEFKNLTFLLAGAFDPRDLILDDKVSPFNIAKRVRLDDFSREDIQSLVSLGSWPAQQVTAIAGQIHSWTGGQPYLTQSLCLLVDSGANRLDVDGGVDRLRREDSNHLPPLLSRLHSDKKLREYVDRIRSGQRVLFYPRENRRQAQLELLGVVVADDEGYCRIRNRIYELVLESPVLDPEVRDKGFDSPPAMDKEEERHALLQELDVHKRNLQKLQLMKTKAAGLVPIAVLNQIEDEQREIHRIEQILVLLED